MNLNRIFIFVAAIACLVGCGGGGSGTPAVASPFLGNYAGTWSSPAPVNQSGTSAFTIATDGHVTGTDFNTTLDMTASFSGVISNGGSFSGSVVYPGYSANSISGSLVLQGNVLSGTLQQVSQGSTYPDTFTATQS